jgi:hypothetical protein
MTIFTNLPSTFLKKLYISNFQIPFSRVGNFEIKIRYITRNNIIELCKDLFKLIFENTKNFTFSVK